MRRHLTILLLHIISLVLCPRNSLLWYVHSSRYIWSSAPIICFCKKKYKTSSSSSKIRKDWTERGGLGQGVFTYTLVHAPRQPVAEQSFSNVLTHSHSLRHSRICFLTLVLSHSCCHRRGPRQWREKSAHKAFTAKAAPSTRTRARVTPDFTVPQGAATAMAPFARKGMPVLVAQRMQ